MGYIQDLECSAISYILRNTASQAVVSYIAATKLKGLKTLYAGGYKGILSLYSEVIGCQLTSTITQLIGIYL